MIVEDDIGIQSLISDLLSELLDVSDLQRASSGSSAWNLLTEQEFDFILLDWKLPELEGLAILNRLRLHHHYKHVPVLVVSGFLTDQDFSLIGDFPLTGKLENPSLRNPFRSLF